MTMGLEDTTQPRGPKLDPSTHTEGWESQAQQYIREVETGGSRGLLVSHSS